MTIYLYGAIISFILCTILTVLDKDDIKVGDLLLGLLFVIFSWIAVLSIVCVMIGESKYYKAFSWNKIMRIVVFKKKRKE